MADSVSHQAGAEDSTGTLAAAAGFCARLLIIGAVLYVVGQVLIRLQAIAIPVAIAVLLAAVLAPVASGLSRRGLPRWVATTVVLIAGVTVLGAVLSFVVVSFVTGLPALQQQLIASVAAVQEWAVRGPLGLDPAQIGRIEQQLFGWLRNNWQQVARGAASTVASAGGMLTNAILVLFALVFFVHSGGHLWRGVCRIAPPTQRGRLERAGHSAFTSLISYVRAMGLVALADAVGIGLGLWLLGVPLAGPLTALVFLGGFLPVVGALVSDALAVLITLVTNGLWTALIMCALVLIVQQVEGNVLQPWLLGNAAQLHPLGIVLAVGVGAIMAGVIGALLAVPAVLTVRAIIQPWKADPTEPQNSTRPASDSTATTGTGRSAGSGRSPVGECCPQVEQSGRIGPAISCAG